jgi:hypothetical protein
MISTPLEDSKRATVAIVAPVHVFLREGRKRTLTLEQEDKLTAGHTSEQRVGSIELRLSRPGQCRIDTLRHTGLVFVFLWVAVVAGTRRRICRRMYSPGHEACGTLRAVRSRSE